MVLLWDEAVNRLAHKQTDLMGEIGLKAFEDTIQVGCYVLVGQQCKIRSFSVRLQPVCIAAVHCTCAAATLP
jgi:hypothetical protein